MVSSSSLSLKLTRWYLDHFRALPWRVNRDPYRIWISEVMLQQTTVVAVVPYYERFLARFPDLETLAGSPLEDVLEMWSGLGYYSRARLLHRTAQEVVKLGEWPRLHHELLKLPGLGPYTARAIASLAFDEPVGVVDGNVIRVLSRLHNASLPWWNSSSRESYQAWADELAQTTPSSVVNQALMELGAILCTPQKPKCFLCPWLSVCEAQKNSTQEQLPLKKPRRSKEVWIWEPQLFKKGSKVALVKNQSIPFLKNAWVFPGKARKRDQRPRDFDFRHTITHHEIFVRLKKSISKISTEGEIEWVHPSDLRKWAPASLVQKAWKGFSE